MTLTGLIVFTHFGMLSNVLRKYALWKMHLNEWIMHILIGILIFVFMMPMGFFFLIETPGPYDLVAGAALGLFLTSQYVWDSLHSR